MIRITDEKRVYVDGAGRRWEVPAWSIITEPIGWHTDEHYAVKPVWINGNNEYAIQ